MKNIVIVGLISFLISCSKLTTNNFRVLSSKIASTQVEKGIMTKSNNDYRRVRNILNKTVPLDKFYYSDSLFFLESFHYESGYFYGVLWSRYDSLYYRCLGNKLEIQKKADTIFEDKLIELVSNWNVENIRLNSETDLYPEQFVYATFCTNDNIEVIKFKIY